MKTAIEIVKSLVEKVFLAVVSAIVGMPVVLDCKWENRIWKPEKSAPYKMDYNLVESRIYNNRDISEGRAE